MGNEKVFLLPKLTKEVVSNITGFQLCAYLVALEGWRRGLKLKWYKDETEQFNLYKIESSTHGKFFSLSTDKKKHYFFRSRGDKVLNKTANVCQDKEKTKEILTNEGVPVPQGKVYRISEVEDIIKYTDEIGFPLIIKPLKGSMGKGVHTNINNKNQLRGILDNLASEYNYSKYIIEKHYHGNEYRVYVVGDNVVGATNRIPANVVGDGENSIMNLIKKKNKERKKNPYLASKPIKVDYEVTNLLKEIGYDINSIPKKDEKVYLREISNLSAGGEPIDATDELTAEVKQIAVNALKSLRSIPHAGVDIIVDAISKKNGVVLEINATAEIGFHLFPLEGSARDIPAAIIDYYFPETINDQRSNFYFDYKSILEPLKTWSTDSVEVSASPIGLIYGKKIIVSGKVQKVGYMTWIRVQALRRKMSGYAKGFQNGDIEVVILSENLESLEKFESTCYKGSNRSKVEHVVTKELQMDRPFKLGFEIKTNPKDKKKNTQVGKQKKVNLFEKIVRFIK